MSVNASKGDKITDIRGDLSVIEDTASGGDVSVAIVASEFNDIIVNALLEGALGVLDETGVPGERITVVWVPGAYEIPITAQRLAATGKFDAIITLGCVIRGDTPHFDFVAGECARGVTEVSLKYDLPVMFGVLTTENLDQALIRSGDRDSSENKGRDVTVAALEMIDILKQIHGRG